MDKIAEQGKPQITSLRPRIMLIPNTMGWILGTWAKEILKWNEDRYDIVIFPFGEILEDEARFGDLLQEVDIVHCLSQSIFRVVNQIVNKYRPADLFLISSIHHIVQLSQVEDCLSADKIMVVCRQFQDALISSGVPREKIHLVYNGVDTDLFKPLDKSQARRKLGIPLDAFTIGFSANANSDHDGRKGVDILKSVLANFSQLNDKTHVIMTGPGWQEHIKLFPIDHKRIHYFPYLPTESMPAYYNSLDVYLVSARVEGGPVPPLEAMSCGTAVVSTPVGTIRDFVQDGVNGLLVPINDAEAIVSALIKLEADRQFVVKLGSAGRDTVIKNLQWKNTVSNLDPLYAYKAHADRRGQFKLGQNVFKKITHDLIHKDEARWQRTSRAERGLIKGIKIFFQRTKDFFHGFVTSSR